MTRLAIVDRDRCNPGKCDNLCMKLCPRNRVGEDCIVLDKAIMKAQITEELCIGCGICVNRCPFKAISIINLPEELKKEPIHLYNKNGFVLYNLPTPIFGKVVGIIGKNGIGKSTAIKILAGVLKPNLGKLGKEASYDDLISYFKGSEAQGFFEKLKKGEIKSSYKLQQVDLIAKNYKGKVRDLLTKADEKGKLEEYAALLQISAILDSDITEISGGELQRVAIAATVLKKANLYIFDEPTSYLDIKQRLNVAKFIASLADASTAVLVIEHDMIILDYMTDYIHLMYGKESCYGIVSQVKATKAGINVYLSGYLKEENVRFRDHHIKFEAKPPVQDHSRQGIIASWKNVKKRLGNFELNARDGELHRKNVTGILGENGIGKTSFVKILAGVIEQDSGVVNEKVTVSYKPQYLEGNDQLVSVVLASAIEHYKAQLMSPLNLIDLLDRQLDQLSGGELQRVAIASCLSKEADLYLLDEPSAYLDVEQRLIVSKVIRSLMEERGKACLVVDHDLLFMDYLSDELIVFDGVPARSGTVHGPFRMEDGMNRFLSDLNLTFRRDPESNRPRANKVGSQMDEKQKTEGKLYYA